MALDLHSNVTVTDVLQLDVTKDCVLLKVSYKVKHGKKQYSLWALPDDMRGTKFLPLILASNGRDILLQTGTVIYSGLPATCKRAVNWANNRYYEGV